MCVEYCRIMSKTSATLEIRSSGLPQLNSIDFFKIVTVVNGSYSSSFAGVDLLLNKKSAHTLKFKCKGLH